MTQQSTDKLINDTFHADVIDVDFIQQHLPKGHSCQWLESVPSTQTAVKANSLLVAEHQSAGMGRRGKLWLTPKGRAICLSYRFALPLPVAQMAGYQITTALAITATIHSFEPSAAVQLKWPNDLYHQGKKFAGILINLIPQQQHTEVIVGIGINWQLTTAQLNSVKQAVSNIPLAQLKSNRTPTRSQFIVQLITHIENHNQEFVAHGLSGFLHQWQQHDYLLHQQLAVSGEQLQATGVYQGINQHGELLLQTQQGIKAFCSGEVSVKAV